LRQLLDARQSLAIGACRGFEREQVMAARRVIVPVTTALIASRSQIWRAISGVTCRLEPPPAVPE
jgi:hypothetical protein